VAETAVLGGWLATAVGWEVGGRVLTAVPRAESLTLEDGRVRGRAVVPWAHRADSVQAVIDTADGRLVAGARPEQLQIEPRTNMAGEPRDVVTFDVPLGELLVAPAPDGIHRGALEARGCLTRTVMTAGALEAIAQLTVAYAHERRQFGKPIATFQAVQQHLVTVAQADVRASMAARVAIRAAARDSQTRFEIAAAKVVADEAAVAAARASHQVHGALGLAREYRLQQFTRRLFSWRNEFGSARRWSRVLGREVVEAGADELFPGITR
jgi:acyl-CoA dehydrogenase